jgi:hypothetical protein
MSESGREARIKRGREGERERGRAREGGRARGRELLLLHCGSTPLSVWQYPKTAVFGSILGAYMRARACSRARA